MMYMKDEASGRVETVRGFLDRIVAEVVLSTTDPNVVELADSDLMEDDDEQEASSH